MVIEGWVLWTLLAALMQSVRTAGQKYLAQEVTPLAATMVRYLFGLPFAVLYLALLVTGFSSNQILLPEPDIDFFVAGFFAGVLQIVATILLIRLFALRSFAVGSTYVKTEVFLTAMIGFAFFSETVSILGFVAIAICVVGLISISISRTGALHSFWNLSAVYGLGAGLSFALTSLLLRHASLSFGIDDAMLTAAMTLSYMVVIQTVITVVWVAVSDPVQFGKVLKLWRPSLFVGITSVIGSVGWFTAMTLELASYVKTVGQVEFLITFAIGWFYFKERPARLELIGMTLIVFAVILLLSVP